MSSSLLSFGVGGSVIFGREDDKRRIIELILADDTEKNNSTFVPIVADRGTGRTTILHLIYNDERVYSAFDRRRLICMPDKFDEKRLMRVIIESLAGVPCDITDPEILKEIIKEELGFRV